VVVPWHEKYLYYDCLPVHAESVAEVGGERLVLELEGVEVIRVQMLAS